MVNLDPPPDPTRLMSHLRRSQSHPDQPKASKGTSPVFACYLALFKMTEITLLI